MLPISVVIPCFKQDQYLGRAIESAADQCDDIIVFKDDGVFRKGVCCARNHMIQNARHDLIFCLDADDRLYPGALQRIYDAWQPGTWVYGEKYTEIAEDESVIREMSTSPPAMIFRKNLSFASILFHRDDWKRVGGYDVDFEPLEEDYAFQCALVNAGVKAVQLEGDPIYRRMIHANSRTAKAMKYWNVTLEMCKERYPGAFVV